MTIFLISDLLFGQIKNKEINPTSVQKHFAQGYNTLALAGFDPKKIPDDL